MNTAKDKVAVREKLSGDVEWGLRCGGQDEGFHSKRNISQMNTTCNSLPVEGTRNKQSISYCFLPYSPECTIHMSIIILVIITTNMVIIFIIIDMIIIIIILTVIAKYLLDIYNCEMISGAGYSNG